MFYFSLFDWINVYYFVFFEENPNFNSPLNTYLCFEKNCAFAESSSDPSKKLFAILKFLINFYFYCNIRIFVSCFCVVFEKEHRDKWDILFQPSFRGCLIFLKVVQYICTLKLADIEKKKEPMFFSINWK